MKPRVIPREDVKVCNCAGCNMLMLGETTARLVDVGKHVLTWGSFLPRVAHRTPDGRPYCFKCKPIHVGRETRG